MRWRERRQRSILSVISEPCLGRGVTPAELRITAPTQRLSNGALCFVTEPHSVRRDLLVPTADPYTIGPRLSAQGKSVPIEFISGQRTVALIGTDEVLAHTVDLLIRSEPITKFSFSRIRRENGLFASLKSHRETPTVRLDPIRREDRPKLEDETATLEDRLRWILTPPIHEQLSDPKLGLPKTPYRHQIEGIAWLESRDSALLADEMGLGKTMQAIIAARLMWRVGRIERILVVCPRALFSTWREEIAEWWPNASANVLEATSDTQRFLKHATQNVTVKLISYEKLAREADWLVKGERCGSHDLIIIDEAQRIKTATSKTAKAVKALVGARRWALTGTPLETKIEDVSSIFGFLRPGLLRSNDVGYIRERIRPFLLRRRVEQVLPDLPEKDDKDVEVQFEDRQREVYDRAEEEGVIELNEKGDSISVQHVFTLIQKLMQICNFEPMTGESCKLERLREDLEEIIESQRKLLIFSLFVEEPFGLNSVKKNLPPYCKVVEMVGEVPQKVRDVGKHLFSTDPSVNTMLLQYKAGGLGLNLQAANYVYLFDRWWNPAVEDQAVKRAHRIGQKNKVFVRRFYCKGTIEERVLQKLAERRRLFTHVIDENKPDDAMGLSEEEFFSLFEKLKARPKRKESTHRVPKISLHNMDDREFEALVAEVYTASGYTVKQTGGSHDGGIDILAEKSTGPARDRIAVQCKHTQATVGRPDLNKLFGVISAEQSITRGDLVTSSDFSSEARAFASGKRLELINRSKLIQWATQLKVAEFTDA